MKKNDPIEELFQQRSKESVGDKPRDLVWKRIESGLQNENKKKKTMKEFISSVWFSAAVFALIAIPYFIFFIENLNTLDQKNSIEFVKMDTFPDIEQKSKTKDLKIIEEIENKDNEPIVIVKNIKKENRDIIEIKPKKNIDPSSENVVIINENKISKTKILDSIEEKGLYAINPKMNLKKIDKNDSLNFKSLDDSFSISSSYYKQREGKLEENKKITPSAAPLLGNSSSINNENNEVKIVYKPLKFTAKTKILRTNFKLIKKTKTKISFVNNSIIICFEKTNNEILLKTNEPNMSFELLDLLENNKKEIFNYYQLQME